MPRTDNQKAVTAYLPLDLYDQLADFKISKGLRSDSQAIAVILEQFFASPMLPEENTKTDGNNDVGKQLKILEQKIILMQVWWKDERDNMLEIMDDLLNRTKFLIPPTIDSNVLGTVVSTVDSDVLGTVVSTVDSDVLGTVDSTVDSDVLGTVDSTVDSDVLGTVDSTVDSDVLGTVDSTVDSDVLGTVDSTVDSDVLGTVVSTVDSDVLGTVASTVESTLGSDVPSTNKNSPLTINSTHPYFERLILCIERDEYLSYWTDSDGFSPDIREAKLYDKQTYLLKQIEKLVERDYERNWLKFTLARNCIKKDGGRYSLQEIFKCWEKLEERKNKRKSARRKATNANQ